MLKNGRRYQGTPGQADFQSMEFERYRMRVSTQVPVLGDDCTVDGMSTPALLALPHNRYADAELLYRIAAPIMCLVLMLLAIPLGFVNPRAGSFGQPDPGAADLLHLQQPGQGCRGQRQAGQARLRPGAGGRCTCWCCWPRWRCSPGA